MTTTTLHHNMAFSRTGTSYLSNFINWCAAQQDNRILWIGIGLGIHGCFLTPLTVLTVLASGSGLGLLAITPAMLSMSAVLVVNLAALPTKITIPVFALSILLDIGLIIAAFL